MQGLASQGVQSADCRTALLYLCFLIFIVVGGIVRKGVVAVIAVALIGWLGYSAYDMHESNKERAVTEVNYDSITDYLNGLSSAE